MKLADMRAAIQGVLAFSPALMHDDSSLDLEAQARHARFLAESGVGAVVAGGGVAEFYALTGGEYADLVSATVDAVAGRVPVFAGVGHSTAIAASQAAAAAQAGADGLMVNPLYFVRPETRGLVRHYSEISEASGLGMIVFSTEGAVYDERELETLAEVEGAVAVKDEVGDAALFARCRSALGDRYEWINGMAETRAYEYAGLGATAMTSGVVNIDPALALAVWDASLARDEVRYVELMQRGVEKIAELRTRRSGYHITVIKEAMEQLGRSTGRVRLPLVPLDVESRAELNHHLATYLTTPTH